MTSTSFTKLLAAATLAAVALSTSAEPLPPRLQGSWRITRVLPTHNTACWGSEQAEPLVGSTLTYREDAMVWKGGQIEVNDITTRELTAEKFSEENRSADFAQLGIHAHSVLEVNMQHEDADITGATTEVPGDSVLLVSPNRIVVSACGVYFEATRSNTVARASLRR